MHERRRGRGAGGAGGQLHLVALAAVALVLGCAPGGPGPAAAPLAAAGGAAAAPASLGTLRFVVSDLVSNTYSPVYIAEREGYYRELGLDVDVQSANPPTATQALLANQFDVAHAASPGIAAALKGAPLQLVFVVAEPAMYLIVGRKELNAWTDLKGKTIAVSSTTGTQLLDVSRVLALHGVNAQTDAINYVVPGGSGDEHKLAALRAGSVDAGVFAGVGAVSALEDGYRLIGDMREVRTFDQTFWTMRPTLTSKRDQLRAFVLGTLKGQQVYRHDRARAVDHVAAQIGGNRQWAEQLVGLSAPAFSDDGIPSDAGLREAMQYKLEAGGESSSVTAEQIVAWDLLRQTNDDLARSGWTP